MIKQLLLVAVCGLSVLNVAHATSTTVPTSASLISSDPACKEAKQYMNTYVTEIQKAVAEKDATKIGNLVLDSQTYMQKVIKKHPQCAPTLPTM